QIPTLLIAAFLLACSVGCKGKQDVAATAESTPTPEVQETTGTAHVESDPPVSAEEPQHPVKWGPDSVFFSIERTPCFGTCPTSTLTLMRDGAAIYEGRRCAPREGRYSGQVDAATMQALKEEAEARGFYGMDDVYDRPVTDLPSVIIRVNADGRDKQVVGRVGPPQAFKNFTQRAEELLAPIAWTKVDGPQD